MNFAFCGFLFLLMKSKLLSASLYKNSSSSGQLTWLSICFNSSSFRASSGRCRFVLCRHNLK